MQREGKGKGVIGRWGGGERGADINHVSMHKHELFFDQKRKEKEKKSRLTLVQNTNP